MVLNNINMFFKLNISFTLCLNSNKINSYMFIIFLFTFIESISHGHLG